MGETSVAKGLRSIANDYDAACKRLLAERQVLSRILQGCLDEFATADLQTIEQTCLAGDVHIGTDPVDRDEAAGRVLALSAEDTTVAEGKATFDIRFYATVPGNNGDGDCVSVEINVEAQNKYDPGYPLLKRAIYYCGRLISMQGTDVVSRSRYGRLRKVASIWVCTHPNKQHAGTATSFRIEPRDLIGNAEYQRPDYDLIEVVMLCLNDAEPGSSEGALGMLEVLLTTRMSAGKKLAWLSGRYGMIMTEAMNEEVDEMCNLSEGVLEEGREQERRKFAEERGRFAEERGRFAEERGRFAEERGRFAEERGRFFETALSLVRDGILAPREAAERFGFPEGDILGALQ